MRKTFVFVFSNFIICERVCVYVLDVCVAARGQHGMSFSAGLHLIIKLLFIIKVALRQFQTSIECILFLPPHPLSYPSSPTPYLSSAANLFPTLFLLVLSVPLWVCPGPPRETGGSPVISQLKDSTFSTPTVHQWLVNQTVRAGIP